MKHFKYLGPISISYSLQDDFDIKSRIAANPDQILVQPACLHLQQNLIFRAIPMSLLLWGCKAWSLQQSLLDNLIVSLHRSIRRILKISMFQVKKERKTNDQVENDSLHTMCREYNRSTTTIIHLESCRDPHPL